MNLSGFFKQRLTLARVFLALVVLYVALQWGIKATGIASLVSFGVVITGAVVAFRVARDLIKKSIWRLRNRLLVTYIFIGVVPIILTIALVAVSTYIVVGQVAVYMISSEIEHRAALLDASARMLARALPVDRAAMAPQIAQLLAEPLPGLQIIVTGDKGFHYPPGDDRDSLSEHVREYKGYLAKGNRYFTASIVGKEAAFTAALAPISSQVLERIVGSIGALKIGGQDAYDGGIPGTIAGKIPVPYQGWRLLDFPINWPLLISVADWNNPDHSDTGYLVITTRPSAVLSAVFSNGIDSSQFAVVLLVLGASLLLAAVLVSVVIGGSLTRSVTGSVHGLYEGTLQIAKGNFAWRIPVKGSDQLAALGTSFNTMTSRIEQLVVVSKEKERLQSEVEIAGEVQLQLFPRSAPSMRTIELIGICHPARMVSGDYYDYLCLPDGNLALAIGDVAGKGISAALLMASIQSIIRTQLAAGLQMSAAAGNGQKSTHVSTSRVVAQLNRQLHANTAPEKYATFFFGVYDDLSRVLTYTNAGHLPPLLLRRGETQLLEVTGTVVGAFPAVVYEEQTVHMEAGDLLIAYTDGITEPENAYGEEFGTERLAETIRRSQNTEPREIAARIMEAVKQWSMAPELPDDMTVVIARGLA